MTIIGTKWVYRNKLDENGFVSRNKARLVVQGYNQQEGIKYDETYAPIARLESIRILIAYACALDFKLFQMDIKSAFLNGFINEEVYVAQPLGFINFEKPDHVYKLKKALYGLKQAPKACSTYQDMCDEFAKIMHDEFEMSMMGELNFFLGLQMKQIEDGVFFNQSKYIKEMLKKFGLEDSKPMKTPMSSDVKLTKDEECESVDSTKYRGMIGSMDLIIAIGLSTPTQCCEIIGLDGMICLELFAYIHCHIALLSIVEILAELLGLRMYTPMFVDPESSTQTDGGQSSQVLVPLPDDPYEAIRTVRMAVRVLPAMSLVLSASITEVVAISKSAFRKRLSVSPPDLHSRKRYRGTSELVEDSEEDEEIDESLDSDCVGEDAKDEGSTTEDEDPATGDEGLATGVEGPDMDNESYGLDDESHGMDDEDRGLGDEGHSSERPERVSAFRHPTLTTWTDPEDGMVYIDVPTYPPPATPVQTPPSPEWMPGLLPISPSPFVVPLPISSPMVPLTAPSPVASPTMAETEGFLTELGAQVEM
ncbi:retrovirus-related pol polyprotein from transposon TNT 1-94 [Tanacetum coccineum]